MGCCNSKNGAASESSDMFDFDSVSDVLRELLTEAIEFAIKMVSKVGGFLANKDIKIPWPAEIANVKKRLEKFGLDEEVKQFVERLNRAAELAAPAATDIFVDAITGLNFDKLDAILHGPPTAATDYLKETTYERLKGVFNPIIDKFLEDESVTGLLDDCISAYNKLPLVDDIDFDLSTYSVTKALDGIFKMLAKREAEVRESPALAKSEKVLKLFSRVDDLFFDSSDDEHKEGSTAASDASNASNASSAA